MGPLDDLRYELQRAGKAWVELLLPELQALRRGIVGDIAIELRQSSRKKSSRRADPRKDAIARLIRDNPEITNLQICHEMDKLQDKSPDYAPLRSWHCGVWWESYREVGNRVHAYLGSIRRSLR